ncbi:MAG: NUDIX hydrolase N-terminal domain-containing protein [Ardenticatenaceae bacterium]|nr:NUDIX hydrolase N-terminal domain-containing protein [Ardenticatenaceae bacterium]
MMDLAQQIALWADQMLEMAALGQRYEENFYAQERYRKLQTLALEMLALASGVDVASLEPLCSPVLARPTPFAVADCAVFDENGRIALIQRADNAMWAMPGGALEVGETAAAGAAREFHEETGMTCTIDRLGGVFDSRLWGSRSPHHLLQFVFLGRLVDGEQMGHGSHQQEVLNVGWFAEEALPAVIDPNHVARLPVVFKVWRGAERPYFDA